MTPSPVRDQPARFVPLRSTALRTLALTATDFAELGLQRRLNFREVQPVVPLEILHSRGTDEAAVLVIKAVDALTRQKECILTFVFVREAREWCISHVRSNEVSALSLRAELHVTLS